jgi:hypothetical protein
MRCGTLTAAATQPQLHTASRDPLAPALVDLFLRGVLCCGGISSVVRETAVANCQEHLWMYLRVHMDLLLCAVAY